MAKKKRTKLKLPGNFKPVKFGPGAKYTIPVNPELTSGGTYKGIFGATPVENDPRFLKQIQERTDALKLTRQQQSIPRLAAEKLAEEKRLAAKYAEYTAEAEKRRVSGLNRWQKAGRYIGKGARLGGGLLGGAARIATGPIGLGLTAAYYGGRALGYDPFGEDVPKEQPVQQNYTRRTPVENPGMRFGEVLRPSSNSTAKEVLNASLLRAGLSLMRPTRPGQTPLTQALESASTVADSQNTFRSGKEALEAGQNALGEAAKIVVRQNSNGTYNYTGTTDSSINASTYFGDEDENAVDQASLVAIMDKNPNLTKVQVVAKLKQQGYTITGE